MNTSRQGRAGFSLIELLVVVMIIGTLVGLLLPAVQAAREAARRIQCVSHLRQVGLALHHYHDAHRALPAGSIVAADFPLRTTGWGWGAKILPYLEQAPLFDALNMTVPVAESENQTALRQSLTVFSCPSDPAPGAIQAGPFAVTTGNYAGSAGSRGLGTPGVLYEMSVVDFAKITDGLSRTFLVGERLNQLQARCHQLHLGVVRPPLQAIRRASEFDPPPRCHRFRADQHGAQLPGMLQQPALPRGPSSCCAMGRSTSSARP